MAIPVWHRLQIDLQDHVAGALPFGCTFIARFARMRSIQGLNNRQKWSVMLLKLSSRIAPSGSLKQTTLILASDEWCHFVGQCLSPNGGDVML